mgnify:CR=1 FL=1
MLHASRAPLRLRRPQAPNCLVGAPVSHHGRAGVSRRRNENLEVVVLLGVVSESFEARTSDHADCLAVNQIPAKSGTRSRRTTARRSTSKLSRTTLGFRSVPSWTCTREPRTRRISRWLKTSPTLPSATFRLQLESSRKVVSMMGRRMTRETFRPLVSLPDRSHVSRCADPLASQMVDPSTTCLGVARATPSW